MIDQLTEHLRRAWHRSGFYLDVPGLLQLLKFKELREGYYRELWRTASANVGARMEPWEYGYTRLERDGLTTIVKQGLVMLDDHLLLDVMGNKALTLSLLEEKGIPTPRAKAFEMSSLSIAEEFLAHCGGEVVVKPARGTGGGRGVTTRLATVSALRQACRLAARFDTRLVVEEQVAGSSYSRAGWVFAASIKVPPGPTSRMSRNEYLKFSVRSG